MDQDYWLKVSYSKDETFTVGQVLKTTSYGPTLLSSIEPHQHASPKLLDTSVIDYILHETVIQAIIVHFKGAGKKFILTAAKLMTIRNDRPELRRRANKRDYYVIPASEWDLQPQREPFAPPSWKGLNKEMKIVKDIVKEKTAPSPVNTHVIEMTAEDVDNLFDPKEFETPAAKAKELKRRDSAKSRVLVRLQQGPAYNYELCALEVGGIEGCKRVRELRAEGWDILDERIEGGKYLYTLKGRK